MTGFLDATIRVSFDALDLNVSIRADRREIVALVGANGAGKSTILRAIAGLQPISEGRVVLDGTVVDDPATGVFAPPHTRRVGFVFQDYRLFPHLDALDNVAIGLRSTRSRRDARQVATDWLRRFDLADHLHHRPAALSGGQAQRVALARSLAREPDVLLLDEPLAASDPEARSRIRGDLAGYLTDFGGVTIVVSHDHSDIEVLATRVIQLARGQVHSDAPQPADRQARTRAR